MEKQNVEVYLFRPGSSERVNYTNTTATTAIVRPKESIFGSKRKVEASEFTKATSTGKASKEQIKVKGVPTTHSPLIRKKMDRVSSNESFLNSSGFRATINRSTIYEAAKSPKNNSIGYEKQVMTRAQESTRKTGSETAMVQTTTEKTPATLNLTGKENNVSEMNKEKHITQTPSNEIQSKNHTYQTSTNIHEIKSASGVKTAKPLLPPTHISTPRTASSVVKGRVTEEEKSTLSIPTVFSNTPDKHLVKNFSRASKPSPITTSRTNSIIKIDNLPSNKTWRNKQEKSGDWLESTKSTDDLLPTPTKTLTMASRKSIHAEGTRKVDFLSSKVYRLSISSSSTATPQLNEISKLTKMTSSLPIISTKTMAPLANRRSKGTDDPEEMNKSKSKFITPTRSSNVKTLISGEAEATKVLKSTSITRAPSANVGKTPRATLQETITVTDMNKSSTKPTKFLSSALSVSVVKSKGNKASSASMNIIGTETAFVRVSSAKGSVKSSIIDVGKSLVSTRPTTTKHASPSKRISKASTKKLHTSVASTMSALQSTEVSYTTMKPSRSEHIPKAHEASNVPAIELTTPSGRPYVESKHHTDENSRSQLTTIVTGLPPTQVPAITKVKKTIYTGCIDLTRLPLWAIIILVAHLVVVLYLMVDGVLGVCCKVGIIYSLHDSCCRDVFLLGLEEKSHGQAVKYIG